MPPSWNRSLDNAGYCAKERHVCILALMLCDSITRQTGPRSGKSLSLTSRRVAHRCTPFASARVDGARLEYAGGRSAAEERQVRMRAKLSTKREGGAT